MIGQGIGCVALARLASGEKGQIIDGPQQITADGNGYTWWKVRWPARGIEAWTAENFLQRAGIPDPECPCELGLAIPEPHPDGGWNPAIRSRPGTSVCGGELGEAVLGSERRLAGARIHLHACTVQFTILEQKQAPAFTA